MSQFDATFPVAIAVIVDRLARGIHPLDRHDIELATIVVFILMASHSYQQSTLARKGFGYYDGVTGDFRLKESCN